MSNTLERMGVACALIATLAVGLWRCATPSDVEGAHAQAERRRSPVASRGFGPRGGAGHGPSAYAPIPDGGLPSLADDREIYCLTVRVVDPDNRPVAALVLATEDARAIEGASPWRGETRTDSGVAEVCAPADAHVFLDAWDDDGRWGRASIYTWQREEAPGDPPSEPLVLRVDDPFTVAGRVVDARGAPVAGADVMITTFLGRDERTGEVVAGGGGESEVLTGEHRITSGPDGRFEVPVGRRGVFAVAAEHPDFLPHRVGPIVVRGGGRADVELRLPDGARLQGRVVHAGEPITDAHVAISFSGGYRSMTTGDDGRFEFESLDPDEHLYVMVSAEGFVSEQYEALEPGSHELELSRGAALEVTVRPSAALARCVGPPPAGDLPEWLPYGHGSPAFEVVVAGDTTEARQPLFHHSQTARLTSLAPGERTVYATGFSGRGEAAVQLVAGQTHAVTVDLGLAEGVGAIHPIVTAAPDGYGMIQARLELPGGLPRVELIGPDGRGCLAAPPGRYRVAVWQADVWGARASVEVTAGRVTDMPVTLAPLEEDAPRDAAPEALALDCRPALEWIWYDDRPIVAWAAPHLTTLHPGDRLVAIGDEPDADTYRLIGPEGTDVGVEVERPDGTRAHVTLTRDDCF